MKPETETQIQEIDDALDMLYYMLTHELFISPVKRHSIREQIDKNLDKRLVLMKGKDGTV